MRSGGVPEAGPPQGGVPAQILTADMPAETKAWRPGEPMDWFGGALRADISANERLEYRENWLDFNDDYDLRDDVGLFQRLRFGLMIRPSSWLTVYGQFQDSRTFFDETRGDVGDPFRGMRAYSAAPDQSREFVLSNSSIDLYEGWAEFGGLDAGHWALRVGRQVLAYGDNRLIGPGTPWNNNGRTFDAAKAQYRSDGFQVDIFGGWVVLHKNDRFNDPDMADLLTGIYATTTMVPAHTVDAYVLYRNKSDVEFSTVYTDRPQQNAGNTAPPGDYFTFGSRWKSKNGAFGPWDWNGEFAIQMGDVVNPLGFYRTDPRTGERVPVDRIGTRTINTLRQDLLACAAHIEFGYTLHCAWKPRVFIEYSYGSGDENPSDGECGTFQGLLPTVHKYYGFMDLFDWQNMHNPAVGVAAKPTPAIDLTLNFHQFWLDETEDPWRLSTQQAQGGQGRYANALLGNTPVPETTILGKNIRRGAPSSYVGGELDFMVRWKVAKWMQLEAGYSHFFAGDYILDTAPVYGDRRRADGARFAYGQISLGF
ncbi:MAG TPA: alginate export family protein [Verrucomicrobiae bacterium]|nr:alginate export family protein [Verrucomicrobiae bacterium]